MSKLGHNNKCELLKEIQNVLKRVRKSSKICVEQKKHASQKSITEPEKSLQMIRLTFQRFNVYSSIYSLCSRRFQDNCYSRRMCDSK